MTSEERPPSRSTGTRTPAAGARENDSKSGAAASGPKRYLWNRVDPLTSLFLVLPLYVVYQVGVIAQMQCQDGVGCRWTRNGVDFLTGTVFAWTGGSRLTFAIVSVSVAAVLGIAVLWARRTSKLNAKMFLPVIVESAIYASLLGPLISTLQRRLTMGAPGSGSFGGDIVASFGAGLHEELVFRAGLFAGAVFLLTRVGVGRLLAVLLSVTISSLVFSLVHHLGPLGEPFTAQAFIFRTLAGVIFAAIYQVRGFAIAAWTHALYDVWVFALQRMH